MLTRTSLPKLFLALFIAVQCCVGVKYLSNTAIERAYATQVGLVAKMYDELLYGLHLEILGAKKTHPKYTEGLSVQNLLDALEQEKTALEQVPDEQSPFRMAQATAHARLVTGGVGAQVTSISTTIADLNTALAAYPQVETNIRRDIGSATSRIESYVGQGYRRGHFTDAEQVINQLRSRAGNVKRLLGTIDSRDQRPDYVQIYKIGVDSRDLLTQSNSLADRAPRLHETVAQLSGTTRSEHQTILNSFSSAYAAVSRIENYAVYQRRGFAQGLRNAQNEMQSLVDGLIEVNRLNGMEVQDFEGARALLERVRSRLNAIETVIEHTHAFDRKIRSAVANMSSYRSDADSAISRAQSHINQWRSENSQHRAESTLDDARDYYNTARLRESSDPITALEKYQSAESEAEDAYRQVDTYVPPPPSTSSDSSSSSSGGGFGGGSSGGGFSGSSGGGSSSPGGGSFGGPGGGSFGDGG
ncbi:MAG TPA: hypothetical protein VLA04_04975 [Verrucomicrobiae bacterium]|nr:hypothetical protein [Verrucomicrobiae bacterium]